MRQRGGVVRIRPTAWRGSVAFIPLAVLALLSGFGAFGASAAAPATDASEVTHWNQVEVTTLMPFPPPNGGAAPAMQINLGIATRALSAALTPRGTETPQPYLPKKRVGAKASVDAAVATAAYDVLSALVTSA